MFKFEFLKKPTLNDLFINPFMVENSFRTEIKIKPSKWEMNYNTPLFFIGSCFSDNIGSVLQKLKLPVQTNPFGVIYNPSSIARIMLRILDQQEFQNDELIYFNNQWHCFDLHGKHSDIDAKKLLENANSTLQKSFEWLSSSNYLCVTFGTSWVYEHIQKNIIVSNCHKFPEAEFRRFRLTPDDIVAIWTSLLERIYKSYPQLKVIFTVSPIRHTKDGAHENQLSKSTLLLAIDRLENSFGPDKIAYFPSYEIVMDDLRDYRFYNEDMIHISDVAVKYIFDKFKYQYFNNETQLLFNEIEKINNAMKHRLLNADKANTDIFANSILHKIELLHNKYPTINFASENDYFWSLLNK